jgi:hypothetical protein
MDESGWIIENGALGLGTKCGELAWVTFPVAIRFARKEDADAMACGLRGSLREFPLDTVSAEHLWCAPSVRDGDGGEEAGQT